MRSSFLWIALGLMLAPVSASCGAGDASSGDGEVEDAIIGGRADGSHPAAGEIGQRRSHSTVVEWICTGTLIAPDTVLTAAHCVTSASGRHIASSRIRFRTGGRTAAARRVTVSPSYSPGADGAWDDIAVIVLGEDLSPDVPPIPIARESPHEGEAATVIGYGVTHASGAHAGTGAGSRRRARIALDRVGSRELAYAFEGRGACYGDSGGPIVQDLHDGAGEVVVGVTSRGTAEDCTGIELATRVDAFAAWIDRVSTD